MVVRYNLADATHARLSVYNAAGTLVNTLVNGPGAAGEHAVVFDGCDSKGKLLPNGIYFIRLRAGARETNQRITMIR
jgi:flagellar hook assembly protein FlgD